MKRRESIINISLLALAGIGMPNLSALAAELKYKTLLVVSGWQYFNFGDIAHTPQFAELSSPGNKNHSLAQL